MEDSFKPVQPSPSRYNLLDFSFEFISRSLAKTPVAPFERVKILLQTQEVIPSLKDTKYTGISNCISRVYQEQGLLSFWRGFIPSILSYIPSYFLHSFLSRYFKSLFPSDSESAQGLIYRRVVSGCAASVVTLLFIHPIDFLRTRLAADVGTQANREFTNSMDCVKKIVNKDGVKGIYSGYGASVAGILIYRAYFFGAYESAKLYYEEKGISPIRMYYIASFITFTSNLVVYPLEVIKRRMMLQAGKDKFYHSYKDCVQKILRVEGFRGFYNGFIIHLFLLHGLSLLLVLKG